jgi:hypothetical protein
MSVHRIPVDKLSPEALQGVIEEFISGLELIMVK